MIAFTPGELALAREPFGDDLPDTCVIERRSQATDSAGQYTDTWATLATVACRVARIAAGGEVPVGDRLTGTSQWVGTFETTAGGGTAIRESDRVQRQSDSRRFEVVSAGQRTRELSQRVVLVEVGND